MRNLALGIVKETSEIDFLIKELKNPSKQPNQDSNEPKKEGSKRKVSNIPSDFHRSSLGSEFTGRFD